jgi:hypothetical protein
MAQSTTTKSGKKSSSRGTRTIRVVSGRTFQVGAKKARGQRNKRGKAQPSGARMTKSRPPAGPIADDQLGQVAGVPTDADIEERLGDLSNEDRKTLGKIKRLVATHLGSFAAARLWLITPEQGSQVTPAQAIREGRGERVLDALKALWGRNPVYA